MKHGYTNVTGRAGAVVRKTYQGPDAAERQHAEVRVLAALDGRFPVPAVRSAGPGWIETDFVDGEHGQDLLDRADAIAPTPAAVLRECGRVLRELHSLDVQLLGPGMDAVSVIVHGDFGPNNMLFTGQGGDVRAAAVLDWEFSHPGKSIEDVAWCEWIVRMHHPDAVPHLDALFDAYGATPSWSDRQAEMLRRCVELTHFTTRWDPRGPAVEVWRHRTRTVQSWVE